MDDIDEGVAESGVDDPDDFEEDEPPAPLWAKLGTGVVAVVLVGFIAVLATSDGGDGTGRVDSRLIGRAVPELVGTTLDGSTYDIDSARGTWTVINFFASWCAACQAEHPEFIEFADRHSDGSAQMVSVVMGDTESAVREFFDDRGGDWPVIVDAASAPAEFVVLQVPETFLVAPSGLVVDKWIGQITADTLDAAIDRLVAGSSQ
ncbi:MAG: TlpA family protein disulfide reductase [Actinobacteria bacterium]|nr:TlpA family protein disulfide reductase [Actinomycetota bacterium]